MSKKGMNIYHRKSDDRWEGRYKDGYKDNGKVRYRSVYGKTYGEVKEKMLDIIKKSAVLQGKCNLTVNKLFSEWLASKQIQAKESTCANYAFKIEKHLIPAFGNLRFDNLTPKLVYDFIIEKRKNNLSDKYISDLLVVLKGMAKYTSRMYHCMNLIADIGLPKKEKSQLKLYSKKERQQLEAELLKNTDNSKFAIFLSMYTGIRVGELCALKWSDIDLSSGIMHISRTLQRIRDNERKGTKIVETSPKSSSSVRSIPLPDFILKQLKVFWPSNKNTYLISNTLKAAEPRTMEYRFKSILKKAALRDINFHSLRHMFATKCIEVGFDIKTLSELLGHSSVEITLNRYVHSSTERKKHCMDQLKLETV